MGHRPSRTPFSKLRDCKSIPRFACVYHLLQAFSSFRYSWVTVSEPKSCSTLEVTALVKFFCLARITQGQCIQDHLVKTYTLLYGQNKPIPEKGRYKQDHKYPPLQLILLQRKYLCLARQLGFLVFMAVVLSLSTFNNMVVKCT